jgi:hypothetical protein
MMQDMQQGQHMLLVAAELSSPKIVDNHVPNFFAAVLRDKKGTDRDSPDDSRSCVHFCDFPAFSQERVAARTSAVIPDSPNGGSGADLAVFPGIWTHSSYRLLLSA